MDKTNVEDDILDIPGLTSVPELTPPPPTSKFAAIGPGLFLLIQFYLLISTVIFLPYYNWQYAKEHGFAEWFVFGEILPTAKAYIWPYFVFSKSTTVEWTEDEKQNLKHFRAAVSAMNTLGEMSDASKDQLLPVFRVALAEAQQVSDSVLVKLHPELKDHFRNQFQRGLELIIKDFERGRQVAPESGDLVDKWNEWIGKNSKGIQTRLRE